MGTLFNNLITFGAARVERLAGGILRPGLTSLTLMLLIKVLNNVPAFAAFEEVGAGARAPGMGNAFTAIADDAYAIFYNPAGLASLERPQLGVGYSRLFWGLSDQSDLGLSHALYAQPLGGRRGTLGASWQRFALNDIYAEQTYHLSYGRRVLEKRGLGKLSAGVSAKYLHRSFVQPSEAFNAVDRLTSTGQSDPLLTGATGKGVLDFDLGLLHRFGRRTSLGLAIKHLNQPNVAFGSDPDKLPMSLHLGLGYKVLWMNLAGEARLSKSPSGASDRDFVLAAERTFPTLEYGQFGVRGSLGIGSRDFRQVTAGLSYRINKIQADYGFLMPLGTVRDTAGTHRLALSFHFGAPTPEEELSANLLDQMARLREAGKEPYIYELEAMVRPHDVRDPALEEIFREIAGGFYRKAHRLMQEYVKENAEDPSLVRLLKRLELVTLSYSEYPVAEEPWEKALTGGLLAFLEAKDRRSMLLTSYALSLKPANVKLDRFLSRLEEATGIKALRLPEDSPRNMIEELFYRSEAAYNAEDYQQVLALAQDVLELQPENTTAKARVGSIHYLLKEHEKALQVWQEALKEEKDPQERLSLERHIAALSKELGRAAPEGVQPEVQAPPAVAPVDVVLVEKLYQKGVEHYARGEHLQAASAFMKILQLDPENAQARKALDRIQTTYPRRTR